MNLLFPRAGHGPWIALVAVILCWTVTASPRSAYAQSVDVYEQRVQKEVDTDTVSAGRFDDGRMWTFDHPPLDDFESRYGFRPDEVWLRRARLGALRIPGCTASFVSPRGLILTNHHCARSHATDVSREGEALVENGFYAETRSAERRAPNFFAEQLIEIADVTAEVEAALADAETDAERQAARQEAFASITDRRTAAVDDGDGTFRTEIISLYDGAQYSAYTFRRFEDVRLAFLPELKLGYFGGDTDNFTYPRYALDMAIFRVYVDGEPYEPEVHFDWSTEGSKPGDAVFVVGNPGSTRRLETVSQLEFRRDVTDASLLRLVETRIEALQAYAEENDVSPSFQDRLFSFQNVRKLYRGRVEALNDAYIMSRIRQGEQAFRDAIQQDSSLAAAYGGIFDSIAAIQQQKREFAPTYQALRLSNNPVFSSATLRRALAARQYLDRQSAGASEEDLQDLRAQVVGTSRTDAINETLLTARLQDFVHYFGADSEIVQAILDGASPEEAAQSILATSALADSASAARALADETLDLQDPAVAMITAMEDRLQTFRSAWSGLNAREADVAADLGRARFAVYGHEVPPDATFSLRLSDGRVAEYAYNGTVAPAFTTFFGLYGHHHEYGPDSEWGLPARWLSPPSSFDLGTPVNMVSTNDITGGNSGSPVLNRDLQVVGLAFDGNIESLAGDFIYLPGRMRTVSVDVRGMTEALSEIYEADRLLRELVPQRVSRGEPASESR